MGKASAKNAFAFFIEDKRREVASGTVRRPTNVMAFEYSAEWQAMNPSLKKVYEDMAGKRKGSIGIKTCKGVLVSEEVGIEEEAKRREDARRLSVKKVVDTPKSIPDLVAQSFFFITFNVVYQAVDDQKWLPLEVGLVEFSIKDGLKKSYHKFINAGPVPIGLMGKAKQHSVTHQIPLKDFSELEPVTDLKKEMETLFLEMVQVMDGQERAEGEEVDECTEEASRRVLFTSCKAQSQVKGSLRFIASESQCKQYVNLLETERIQILDLEWLLFFLCQRIGRPRPHALISRDFDITAFGYSPNTRCQFHEELDNDYCALGSAKKWCFTLSDVLCPLYKVSASSSHLPLKANCPMITIQTVSWKRRRVDSPAKPSSGPIARLAIDLDKERPYAGVGRGKCARL